MALLQGGGVSFGPNGVCWDCPLSFRDATQLVAVVVVCVAIGIWRRGTGQPRLRTIGSCLLGLAAIEIFVINHAGWNWGIIQAVDPRQYYSPYAVSAFASLLGAAAAGFVIYFDRRLQTITKETEANFVWLTGDWNGPLKSAAAKPQAVSWRVVMLFKRFAFL